MPVKRSGGLDAKLKALSDKMRREVSTAVYTVADSVKVDAQISLSEGAVSGKKHVPSAPGTPPNTDTGALADSIQVERVDDFAARVVVNSPYGAIQELGGTAGGATLPERPYMRPAAKKNQASGQKVMRAAIERALKGE